MVFSADAHLAEGQTFMLWNRGVCNTGKYKNFRVIIIIIINMMLQFAVVAKFIGIYTAFY
jgi:hypothetical protein